MRTPLAWRNLIHNSRRLAVALFGIGFAVVLIFAQTGFQHAMLDSSVRTIAVLDADLILTSTALNTLVSAETFDRRCLVIARGCPGVKAVYPLYIQFLGVPWKGPTGKPHPIRVLACDVDTPVFRCSTSPTRRRAPGARYGAVRRAQQNETLRTAHAAGRDRGPDGGTERPGGASGGHVRIGHRFRRRRQSLDERRELRPLLPAPRRAAIR